MCRVCCGLARDQVPVHHRGSPSGHHGPDPSPGVQQGQLEAGAALGVKVSDVGFLGESREMCQAGCGFYSDHYGGGGTSTSHTVLMAEL